MAGSNDALTAARFSISIDSHSIGRFEQVLAATAPGAVPRALQAHELSLLCRQARTPAASAGWNRSVTSVTMKRGVCDQQSLGRWKAGGTGRITLVVTDPANKPVARYHLTQAWPMKIVQGAAAGKGGSDIAIEEIVIAHEGFDPV